MIILSAKAINPEMTIDERMKLINLCVAIELIHSASLVHDDIIDNDLFRRGQKTLNNIYGRKIAVLAGDAFYAKAFSILLKLPTNDAEQIITQVIEKCALQKLNKLKIMKLQSRITLT